MLAAIIDKNSEKVILCLDHGFEYNSEVEKGEHLLHLLVKHNLYNIILRILKDSKKTINVNIPNLNKDTPIVLFLFI